MSDVTRILSQIESGDPSVADQLLPLVYQELRRLAAIRLAHEKPGQTLQATALVHEAFVRLVGGDQQQRWDSRGHFFSAAVEAMRRILVENARLKQRIKHGGNRQRTDLDDVAIVERGGSDDLLALDEALAKLAAEDQKKAEVVKLRYFGGFTVEEAAELLGISPATAKRYWTYARAFLYAELAGPRTKGNG